ncbi:hypothetical protein GJ654_07855 [Rhodoblastus acidophilus]|uniref:Uncharacterized protein n=1 Tax=Rhodoblastus acidophilus TaxID=1074 RepID=A0A6N8DM04_RHOAC|nr:hypothetical protein [Rhodoblastus acidophilus]MTV30906.1 hypothetical protein [Rhodoblastus acidophilus]
MAGASKGWSTGFSAACYTVFARSLRDPRKRNRAEILQAKGGFPRERNTISELILRKPYEVAPGGLDQNSIYGCGAFRQNLRFL